MKHGVITANRVFVAIVLIVLGPMWRLLSPHAHIAVLTTRPGAASEQLPLGVIQSMPSDGGVDTGQIVRRAASFVALPAGAMPLWFPLALTGLGCVVALSASGLIASRLSRLHQAQRAAVAHETDTGLNARQADTRARLSDVLSIESLAAQLVADALERPVELRPLFLHADAEPTPYLSVTDVSGVRFFFTTDPWLFKRLRIVRRRDPVRNVSALSTSARADMLAIWDALIVLKGFTHIAMPRGADWHVIAFNPLRGRASLFQRLRTWRDARVIAPENNPPPMPIVPSSTALAIVDVAADRDATARGGAA